MNIEEKNKMIQQATRRKVKVIPKCSAIICNGENNGIYQVRKEYTHIGFICESCIDEALKAGFIIIGILTDFQYS